MRGREERRVTPRIVCIEVPFMEMGGTKIKSEVKFEMPMTHPSGNVK